MVEGKAKPARLRSPPRSQPTPGGPRRPGVFAVVGIGASAGGLDACTKLLETLPAGNGMAFILIQRLDPTHESMMVDLLASRTAMTVRQAADGMLIEREHLYVIPPGTYLSVGTGALHLTPPQVRHGARLPFDFLLYSLAADYRERAIGVILSGTGADGSLGLKAVKEYGGLVIAQDPDDDGYDGMPRNAITTGAVDLVLPVAKIPEALVQYDRRMTLAPAWNGLHEQDAASGWLPEIIELLRTKTAHDFTLYKPGTLQRRIERRIISLIHFALREDGILLLGSSETAGDVDGRFELIAKSDRLYRHIGRSRPREHGFLMRPGDNVRVPTRRGSGNAPSRQATFADLCRRLVIEAYAPAAMLINREHECLYSLGPTEHYLRVASGHATHDLLAMVDQDMRARLRSAIQQANQEKVRVVVAGASMNHNGHPVSFDIDVQPVRSEDDELLLVCFVDKPKHEQMRGRATTQRGRSQVADLEQELKATKTELQAAIRSLEIAGEEQKAVNEEALSINEEYQSTNEELLTSKEELQSLNEELAALNSQLRESLDRQRTTSTICKTFCTARVLRRSSSIPASKSGSSRPLPSHCSASFPATSGGR